MNLIGNMVTFLQGDTLTAKSARGIMKLAIGTGFERSLRLLRTMILTRILSPGQFGVMAIILSLIGLFEAFAELGIRQSIIQNKQGAEREYLNVAWWFQAIRGLLLFVLALFVSPWICSFYDKPQLLNLLQVTAVSIIFRGFFSPRAYVLEKEYKFGRTVLLVQGSAVLGAIITVIIAVLTKNVWALVIGVVAEQAILLVLSYILAPFLPTCAVNREHLQELMRFARGMFGAPALTMIAMSIPTFVLGKIVTEEQLGMYYLAGQLVNIPLMLFTKIIQPVLLPGFAKKQDDKSSLLRIVLQITRGAAVLSIPTVVFIVGFANTLLLLAWGTRYTAVAVPCAILSLPILIRTQSTILVSACLAVGRPDLVRTCAALKALIVVVFIYPAIVYQGLPGAAICVVAGDLGALAIQILWCRRIINLDLWDYARSYLLGLFLALPVVLTIVAIDLSRIDSPILAVAGAAFIFLATVLTGLFLYQRRQ